MSKDGEEFKIGECPECGGKGNLVTISSGSGTTLYYVHCTKCSTETVRFTRADIAVKTWNNCPKRKERKVVAAKKGKTKDKRKDKRKDEAPALKPCPECKTGKAKFVEIPVDCKDGHTSLFKVECTKCHAVTVYCVSKKEAAEAWNNPAKMKAKQRAFIGRLLKWTNEYAKAREEREKAVIKKDYVVEVRKDGKVECTMPCLNKLKAYKVARELSECKGYVCQVKVQETMPWRGLSTFEGGKMKCGTTDGKKTVAAQKRP